MGSSPISTAPAASARSTRRPSSAPARPTTRMPGSRRSPPKPSVDAAVAMLMASVLTSAASAAEPASLAPYHAEGDGIAAQLPGHPGDPARGRAIVVSRQLGPCVLCHPGPSPEEPFKATIAPDLDGVGSRLTESQI